MKIKKFIIIITIVLIGCQKAIDINIEKNKQEYLEQQYQIFLNHQIMQKQTVYLTLTSNNLKTYGHGALIKIYHKIYVLTNNHVVYLFESTDTIEVHMFDGTKVLGSVVYQDSKFDLALIEIKLDNITLTVDLLVETSIKINAVINSPRLVKGNKEIIRGILLNKDKVLIQDVDKLIADIDFDVYILEMISQEGISGGPVFDEDLNFIGLIYAGNLQPKKLSRVYVIPRDEILAFIEQFKNQDEK
jgi:hypothetical protein